MSAAGKCDGTAQDNKQAHLGRQARRARATCLGTACSCDRSNIRLAHHRRHVCSRCRSSGFSQHHRWARRLWGVGW